MNEQLTPWIKVEDGDLFEGNFGHWEDTFFAFPDSFSTEDKLAQITHFCEMSGFDLKITWKNKDGLTVRTDIPEKIGCSCCH